MGGKSMEGSPEQKRQAAREAREEGKKPSEMSATTGGSQQQKRSDDSQSHEEQMDLRSEGKPEQLHHRDQAEARPRSRDARDD
jgi:hypothetical protein